MRLRWSSTIIQITIDFFLIEQLRTASKMPTLPCKPHVRLWVLSSEEYKEPEDALKKISWDTVGFRDYFLNKVHRLFEKVRGSVASVKSRGVLNHPQSFVFSCSYFVFLKYLQRFFFLCLLKYIREVDSRISCVVQYNWMLLLVYCENACNFHVLN